MAKNPPVPGGIRLSFVILAVIVLMTIGLAIFCATRIDEADDDVGKRGAVGRTDLQVRL